MRVMERISYLVVVVSSDIKWEIGGSNEGVGFKEFQSTKEHPRRKMQP